MKIVNKEQKHMFECFTLLGTLFPMYLIILGSISSMLYEQLLRKRSQKHQKDQQLDCLFCAFRICARSSMLMKLAPGGALIRPYGQLYTMLA